MFTLGENFGELLQNIAYEKCFYEFQPEKAVEILTESCPGMEDDLAKQIILKRAKINVVNNSEISVETNVKTDFSLQSWFDKKIDKLIEQNEGGNESVPTLKLVKDFIVVNSRRRLSISLADFIKYPKDQSISEAFEDDEVMITYQNLLKFIEQDLLSFENVTKVYSYFTEKSVKFPETYYDLIYARNLLIDPKLFENVVEENKKRITEISDFVKRKKEIDEMTEINPTLSLHDAGFISPEGLYYGLNGDAGHFKHLNIANLLYQQGTIDIRNGIIEGSPERWLESNGWLKQNGSTLFYIGYFNDIPVTKEQMLTAQKLLSQKYSCVELQDFSVSVNKLLEIDEFQLKKHFT